MLNNAQTHYTKKGFPTDVVLKVPEDAPKKTPGKPYDRDQEKIDHGEGFGACPLEQDRALALVAGERGAVEAWRPLSGVVEVNHDAVSESVGGGDLKVAAEILGHYDTSASGWRTRAARAATSPTMMRLGPASPDEE